MPRHAVEEHGVDGCRAERFDQRLVVGHEHRAELNRAIEAVIVDRPDSTADAVTGLDDNHLEAGIDEVRRGGQPGHAGADHGDPLVRLGKAGDLLGRRPPGVARAGKRSRRVGGAGLSRDPRRSSTGWARDSRSAGVVPTASYENAPRANGSALHADRRIAVGTGTPFGAVGVGVGVGAGLAVGDGARVGLGCGEMQLDKVTAAIPESDAARKVRRSMPPGVARESMGFRLADRPGGGLDSTSAPNSTGVRPGGTSGEGSVGPSGGCGARRTRPWAQKCRKIRFSSPSQHGGFIRSLQPGRCCMGARRLYPDAVRDRFVGLVLGGESVSSAARVLGVPVPTVERWWWAASVGVPLRKGWRGGAAELVRAEPFVVDPLPPSHGKSGRYLSDADRAVIQAFWRGSSPCRRSAR